MSENEIDGATWSGDVAVLDEPIITTRKKPPETKRQPPYAVIVLNDDLHTFEYVILTLCKVCGHSTEKAYGLATQIHNEGRAVVWSGTLELAELKRDQITGFGVDTFASKPVEFPLGVEIEPMPG